MLDVTHVEIAHRKNGEGTIFEFCYKGGVGTLRNLNTGDGFSARVQIWSVIQTYLERDPLRDLRIVIFLGKDHFEFTRINEDVCLEYVGVPKREFSIPLVALKSIFNEMQEALLV